MALDPQEPLAAGSPVLVTLPAVTVVGIEVAAPFQALWTAVPRAWREVFARHSEPPEEGFVELSLGATDGIYREVVGRRAPAGGAVPAGMVAVELPAARYAHLHHAGPLRDVAASFGVLEAWVAAGTGALRSAARERLHHDGVKLDVGYLPDASETAEGGIGHELYIRVVPQG